MKQKWSRRQFLEAGLAGSVPVIEPKVFGLTAVQRKGGMQDQTVTIYVLAARDRKLLRAAMDEIIPAGDGMPAASEVGGVDYLSRLASRDREVSITLRKNLATLETFSQRYFNASFLSLLHEQRVESLTMFQQRDEHAFGVLRDFVYEAYYEQPCVRKLIGYEDYPTNEAGPRMKPFNETVLAQVRKKPRYYREV